MNRVSVTVLAVPNVCLLELGYSRRVGVTVRERFTAAGFQPFGLEARLTLRR